MKLFNIAPEFEFRVVVPEERGAIIRFVCLAKELVFGVLGLFEVFLFATLLDSVKVPVAFWYNVVRDLGVVFKVEAGLVEAKVALLTFSLPNTFFVGLLGVELAIFPPFKGMFAVGLEPDAPLLSRFPRAPLLPVIITFGGVALFQYPPKSLPGI